MATIVQAPPATVAVFPDASLYADTVTVPDPENVTTSFTANPSDHDVGVVDDAPVTPSICAELQMFPPPTVAVAVTCTRSSATAPALHVGLAALISK